MNELIQTFNFGVSQVRTAIKDNGDVYFCLTDVATILEISNANPSRFNLDEAGVHKMYTPTNGGIQLGISANKVGKLTNTHNLKTDKYGMRVLDKARGHSKQVETFRYYDNVIPVLKGILESEVNI